MMIVLVDRKEKTRPSSALFFFSFSSLPHHHTDLLDLFWIWGGGAVVLRWPLCLDGTLTVKFLILALRLTKKASTENILPCMTFPVTF